MRPVAVLLVTLLIFLALTVPVEGSALPRHALDEHAVHAMASPTPNTVKPSSSNPMPGFVTSVAQDTVGAVTLISTTHAKHLSAPTYKFNCLSDPMVHYLLIDYDAPLVSQHKTLIQRWFTHEYCDDSGVFTWNSEIIGAFDNSFVACRSWFVVTHHMTSGWGQWSNGLSYQLGGNNNSACPPAGI